MKRYFVGSALVFAVMFFTLAVSNWILLEHRLGWPWQLTALAFVPLGFGSLFLAWIFAGETWRQ